jgi:predicted PurR-regulated permease PerM
MWGVAGMFLFIPLFGMFKIVCDHIPSLHPYGYLIGNEQKSENKFGKKIKGWFKEKFSKS